MLKFELDMWVFLWHDEGWLLFTIAMWLTFDNQEKTHLQAISGLISNLASSQRLGLPPMFQVLDQRLAQVDREVAQW